MNTFKKLAINLTRYESSISIKRKLVSFNKLDKNLITTNRKLNLINPNAKPLTQEDVIYYFIFFF